MRESEKNKRNYIIMGLCSILMIMAVGFAVFSQELQINSTSEVTSTWDVHIKDNGVTYKNVVDATSTLAEKTSSLVATFACNLTTPGTSTISYDIVVENKGSLNAKLDEINLTGGNSAISVVTSPANASLSTSPIVLGPNDETTITVIVTYNNVQTQPTGDGAITNITATLNFSQTADSSTIPHPRTPADVVEMMGVTTVTSGDGLYDNGNGTYTYKGSNPPNYINFNNETWRIMSINSYGIKIIREETIGNKAFDSSRARSRDRNTACFDTYYGCALWCATSKMVGSPENFRGRTLVDDSQMYTYLNETYYNSITYNRNAMVDGIFDVGIDGEWTDYQWIGHVALATTLDYSNAQINGNYSNVYLNKEYDWLTMTSLSNPESMYRIKSSGGANGYTSPSYGGYAVRPVLYISNDITLIGTGTDAQNAFIIDD